VTHFPADAPQVKVVKALELLGFSLVREREHIAMIRENADGRHTPRRVFDCVSQHLIAFFLAPSFKTTTCCQMPIELIAPSSKATRVLPTLPSPAVALFATKRIVERLM
jgi:hypothetical protein